MVAADVVEHRVVGNLKDIVLQFLERTDAGYLIACLRVTENEVAKTHVFLNEQTQVDIHRL